MVQAENRQSLILEEVKTALNVVRTKMQFALVSELRVLN